MPQANLLSARLRLNDEKIRTWWTSLDGNQASDELRAAAEFYIDYAHYSKLLQLIDLLGISESDAMQRLRSAQVTSVKIDSVNNLANTKSSSADGYFMDNLQPKPNISKKMLQLLDD